MPDELVPSGKVDAVVESVPIIGEPAPEGVVDQPPDPSSVQAEIERLQQVREKAKADAEYWRRQKAEARADYFKSRGRDRGEESPTKPAVDLGIGPPPKKDDFDDYDKFTEALVAYNVNKAKMEWDQEAEKRNRETSFEQRMQETREKTLSLGVAKYSDFEEVAINPTVPITAVIMDALGQSDIPHDVAYYLGKNRTEAIKLSRMTPTQVGREIARIEMVIKQEEAANPIKPKKITNAPPPIKPITSASATVEKDPNSMSQHEFEAWREGHGARRY